MEELLQVQIFYRKYLSKYTLARRLKPYAVRVWNAGIYIKYFIIWQYSRAKIFCVRLMTNHRKLINRAYSYSMRQIFHCSPKPVQDILKEVGLSYFSLISFADYCRLNQLKAVILAQEEKILLQMPKVYPENYGDKIHSNPWPVDVPSVYAFKVNNAEIIGKSDFIFTKYKCLHHGLYQFERDLPAEEIHGIVSINAQNKTIFRNFNKKAQIVVEKGINLLGSATSNYIHWLTETAPKLALINQCNDFLDFPLIIDEDLHPNIISSINCLNGKNRKLIAFKRGEICHVKRLIVVSPVAYIPFEFRAGLTSKDLNIDPSYAMYIPSGVRLLRKILIEKFAKCSGTRKKLYLKRTASTRKLKNSNEVEAVLKENGFEFIELDGLNFIEQVNLFSDARIILSQGGASLGNIIFAPEDCHIVALSAWSPYTIYYYFSNLASVLKQTFDWIICEPSNDPEDHHQAHKGIIVNIETLKRVIENEPKNRF